VLVAFSVLLAVACLVPATAKLLGLPMMREAAGHFSIPWPRYRLIGVAELAAAAGVLVGLIWRPAGIAAACGMGLLLLGALAAHRRAGDAPSEAGRAVVALLVTVAYLAVVFTR